MFQSNDASVYVIGSQFMVPYPIELTVVKNSKGDLLITDVNHKILLKVKPNCTTCHDQRLLLDANNQPILLLREKIRSAHNRWNAFKGNSTKNSDIIFSIKKLKMVQSKTNLLVFLANSCEDACDFMITGSWSNKNCAIYKGDSSQTIAQMQQITTSGNVSFDEDSFKVAIAPNVDYAFVIAVFAIIEAMKCSDFDVGEVISNVAQEAALAVAGVIVTGLLS